MAVAVAAAKTDSLDYRQPLRKRVIYHFHSSLRRRGYTRRALRNRLSYSAALRAASPSSQRERPKAEVDLAWVSLWESVSNGGEISPEDEAAILACERWRRKENGERNGLWNRLGRSFKNSPTEWKRLTAGIRSGVPASLRGPVWYACSGAASKRQEAGVSYAELVESGRELRNEAATVIEVDLPRTGVGETQMHQLRNILRAFAAKNPSIGYCQSMNFITKALLLYNEEERTFWILCSLIEDVLPAGYYTPTMSGLRSDLKLLDSLIGQYLPDLKHHMQQRNIDLSPITMNWFLCLFVNTLPVEQSHRVMDCLLHEGPKVLFRAALGILHLREAELLKAEAVVDAYMILRAPFGTASDEDGGLPLASPASGDLLSIMYGLWLKGLSTDTLLQLREEHLSVVGAEDEAHAARKEAYRKDQQAARQAAAAATVGGGDAGRRPEGEPTRPAARPGAADEAAPAAATVPAATAPGDMILAAPPAAKDSEPEQLRAESFAIIEQLPVQPGRLGFAERATDSPKAAARWLAGVTGDEVDEAGEENSTIPGEGVIDEWPVTESTASRPGQVEDGSPHTPQGLTGWFCCQRRLQSGSAVFNGKLASLEGDQPQL